MVVIGGGLNVVIICWVIFLTFWFTAAFFVKRSATKRNWSFDVFWRVLVVILAILLIKYHKTKAVLLFAFLFESLFSFTIIGSALTILGLLGAVWARIYLGRNWSSYVTYKKEHELITTGPYKFVRHPIYSSIILMFIGTYLYYGSLIVLIIILVVGTGYIIRIRKEEEIMTNLFGKKYIEYMKSTKRLIPGIW